jgi:alpha-beta hydrolase superfamily lysophospholipase
VDAFIADPLCFPSLSASSMESFLSAFPLLADPNALRRVRQDLPIYVLSGSDDPIGQRLEGVRALVDRYGSAGVASVFHEFYPGGRHEMFHELNRREVFTDLLVWIAGILRRGINARTAPASV